jgi:hypothetical protein
MVKNNGGDYENPPSGMHNAVCYRVIDLGTQESEYQGNKTVKRQIVISWEIDELMKDGKRFTVSSFYTASLNEKSKLRPMLESWRGRPFTEVELEGFNLENIIGKPCMVNLVENEKGKMRVASVSPLPKGMQAITLTNATEHFDLDKFNDVQFNDLPDGLKKIIVLSPEYKHANSGGHVSDGPSSFGDDLDDSIPF